MRGNQIVINEIRKLVFEVGTRQNKKIKNENKHCHFYLFLNCKINEKQGTPFFD
jgi:hypothetical protein